MAERWNGGTVKGLNPDKRNGGGTGTAVMWNGIGTADCPEPWNRNGAGTGTAVPWNGRSGSGAVPVPILTELN